MDPTQEDLTEPTRFLALLEQLDIRLVNLTAGSPYDTPYIQRPAAYPPADDVDQDRVLRWTREALGPDVNFVAGAYIEDRAGDVVALHRRRMDVSVESGGVPILFQTARLHAGDAAYYALTDALQFLGNVAFREPVPAYKHSAAIFLHLTGRISSNEPHPLNPQRPSWEPEILRDRARRLGYPV